jgi:mono/diheme cytochrome c family protein
MRSRISKITQVAALAMLVSAPQAWADNFRSAPAPAIYTQECAGCHMAYPASLLPQASWNRIMGGLENHYGSDATLDEASLKQISAYLQANSAKSRRASQEPPKDRITQSAWFQRKHDEVSAATFKRASIKSASNCMACHPAADKGDFNEDRIRIPK